MNYVVAGTQPTPPVITTGTSNPPYQAHTDKDATSNVTLQYQAITCMPAYSGYSFEVNAFTLQSHHLFTLFCRNCGYKITCKIERPRVPLDSLPLVLLNLPLESMAPNNHSKQPNHLHSEQPLMPQVQDSVHLVRLQEQTLQAGECSAALGLSSNNPNNPNNNQPNRHLARLVPKHNHNSRQVALSAVLQALSVVLQNQPLVHLEVNI